jgi:hypothetical protein
MKKLLEEIVDLMERANEPMTRLQIGSRCLEVSALLQNPDVVIEPDVFEPILKNRDVARIALAGMVFVLLQSLKDETQET